MCMAIVRTISHTWQTLRQRLFHGAADQYEDRRVEEVPKVDDGDGRRGVGRVGHLLSQLNPDRGHTEREKTTPGKKIDIMFLGYYDNFLE